MRVLIVDNDSEMLENVARRLRDGFSIDIVTSKGDALDLLRQNDLHVVVACERLNDGSGLDLLSQTAKRWPETLRLFAASTDRLELLRGRLGPFKLFQTLNYPIEPGELGSILMLAQAAQAADADTTNVQHIVLGEDSTRQADTAASALARASSAAVAPSLAVARGAARPMPFTVVTPSPSAPASLPATHRKPVTRESLAQATRAAPRVSAAAPVRPRTPSHAPVPRAADVVPALAAMRSQLHGSSRSGFRIERKPLLIGAVVVAVLTFGGLALYLGLGESRDPDAVAEKTQQAQSAAERRTVAASEAARRARARAAAATSSNEAQRRSEAADEPQPTEPVEVIDSESQVVGDSAAAAAPPDVPLGTATAATSMEATALESGAGTSPDAVPSTSTATQTFGGRTLESSSTPGQANSESAAGTALPERPAARQPASTADLPPVVREAKLVKQGDLEYPPDAAARGTEGSVEIEFTVTAAGRVGDAVVKEGTPAGVFDRAALNAVRRWRYEPRIEDGIPVDWRTSVRIEFRLEE